MFTNKFSSNNLTIGDCYKVNHINVAKFSKLNSNRFILLSYADRHYIINENNKVLGIPINQKEYNDNKKDYDTEMDGNKLTDIIINVMHNEKIRIEKNEPAIYGSDLNLVNLYFSN